jgi:ATP-dependent RNA helicase DeaD
MEFKDFPIMPEIVQALTHLQITHPTDIQRKVIPILLSNKKTDMHGQAQTGTGKTLAFGIPLVQSVDPKNGNVQALVVAPTRELALQIAQSIRPMATPLGIGIAAVYGGVSLRDQIRAFKKGVQIVVGTPGRLNDHLKRGTLSLQSLHTLVLDEADIMLDMGFKDEVDEILSYAPQERQIWLFSATVKQGINDLIRTHMRNTVTIKAVSEQKSNSSVKQYFCVVPMRDRSAALMRFVDNAPEFYGFIFCQTKVLTEEVAEQLMRAGYPAHALHGDMTQIQRNRIIRQFKDKEFTILVATDVAARGIDIADLTHVINYSLPEDQESYVHRIGRTGRAGKQGIAITFVGRNEMRYLKILERKFQCTISPLDVPTAEQIAKGQLAQVVNYLEHAQLPADTPELYALVNSYDQAAVVRTAVALLKEKFFKKKMQDSVNFTPISKFDLDTLANDQGQSEVVLYQGLEDGITKDDVTLFLKQHITGLDAQDIGVRVIQRRSFIKLSAQEAEQVAQELRGKKLNGKRVRVSVSVDYGYQRNKGSFAPRSAHESFKGRGRYQPGRRGN